MFCSSFYGTTYKATSYTEGTYSENGVLNWQMHKVEGCRTHGDNIVGTNCPNSNANNNNQCKIWNAKQEQYGHFVGLYDIVCSSGKSYS